MVLEDAIQQTRQVRKALLSIPSLSMGSKNLAIKYHNGIILLQGTVASEQDAEIIYEIALSHTSMPVNNQLTLSEEN
jgi:osmotically-inducible protein OsmY